MTVVKFYQNLQSHEFGGLVFFLNHKYILESTQIVKLSIPSMFTKQLLQI